MGEDYTKSELQGSQGYGTFFLTSLLLFYITQTKHCYVFVLLLSVPMQGQSQPPLKNSHSESTDHLVLGSQRKRKTFKIYWSAGLVP